MSSSMTLVYFLILLHLAIQLRNYSIQIPIKGKDFFSYMKLIRLLSLKL